MKVKLNSELFALVLPDANGNCVPIIFYISNLILCYELITSE